MRVIVVDDERYAKEDIEEKLGRIPGIASIEVFDRPSEALTYAEDHRVDVAFLEIEMYEMTGIELAQKLKDIFSKTNIVFVTRYSEYAVDAFKVQASDYIIKPVSLEKIGKAIENLRNPVLTSKDRIRIQTFGNFEVFVDDKPLIFTNRKAKEMLAYLIDRKGASVTTEELAAVLWKGRSYDGNARANISKVIKNLKNNLETARIEHILIRRWNNISVDMTAFWCDSYAFESGDSFAVSLYSDEYMNQYIWAKKSKCRFAQKIMR